MTIMSCKDRLVAIGARIRKARFSAGMTQAALARATGVSERNIVRWENNQHAPRTEHVAAIARATGHDTDFFLNESSADDDEEDSELAGQFLTALAPLARLLAKAAKA